MVEKPSKHAQAGDRPEEANWEGSEEALVQFKKYAKLTEEAVLVRGPYNRKDGRQFLNIIGEKAKIVGQVWNPDVIPKLIEFAERLGKYEPPATEAPAMVEDNAELARIAKNPSFPLLKQMVEGAAWYQSAMNEIGFTTLIIALQVGKMDPKTVAKEIESFRDEREGKKRFIQLINKRLQALLEAHENADRITELERERDIMGVKLYATEIAFGEAKWQRSRFENHLQMAMACMCGPDMKRFMERQVYASVVSSSAGIGQNQEAVVVEGKGKGTIIE